MLVENLDRERIHRPLRLAAGGEGAEMPLAVLAQDRFREDRTRACFRCTGTERYRCDRTWVLLLSPRLRRTTRREVFDQRRADFRPPVAAIPQHEQHDVLEAREIGTIDDRTAEPLRRHQSRAATESQDATTWCFAAPRAPWRCRRPRARPARASPATGTRPAGSIAPARPAREWHLLIPYIQSYGYFVPCQLGVRRRQPI